MSQKRMFDKSIIDTDKFMDLSMPAKALYFLMGMEADDEGFVSPRKVLRIYGGNDDDVKILISKKFLIPFESGVVVITDWNNNNWLDSRRIKPTQYQNEKKQLTLTGDRTYVLSKGLALAKPVQSSIEESSIPPRKAEDWSFNSEIKKLEDSNRRDLNIIALYLDIRKPDIKTKEQFQVALKRHLRPAKVLSPFTDDQILVGVEKAKKQTPEWTIETITKMLTK